MVGDIVFTKKTINNGMAANGISTLTIPTGITATSYTQASSYLVAVGTFNYDAYGAGFAIRKDGGYDGVVTMYHDQGQIAMKLMGFEKGVTVHGGLPVPITTPAHGTAYDIAGKNLANPQAMFNAFDLACRMGQHHRQLKKQTA